MSCMTSPVCLWAHADTARRSDKPRGLQGGHAQECCSYLSAAIRACAAAGFFSLAPLIKNRKTSRFFLGAGGATSSEAFGDAPFSQSLARSAQVLSIAPG